MLELVRSATVRIERAVDRHHLGTGFFAAPGLVLTAAHVVAAFAPHELAVVWRGQRHTPSDRLLLSEPVAGASHPWPDAAIVAVTVDDHPCVPLSDEWPPELPKRSLYAWTYSTDYNSTTVSGTSVMLDYTGPTAPEPNATWQLVRVDWGRVIPGMSGAPLLDTRDLRVCAIMKSTDEGRQAPSAYATAIADVLQHPAAQDLVKGQQEYRERTKRDVTAEERARWGELPERVGRLIARHQATADLARELAARGVAVDAAIPDEERSLYIARRLFDSDLETVASVFRALIRDGLLKAEDAALIFDSVACCAPLPGDALAWWIPPDAAEQLFMEVTAAAPRIAHVPSDEPATLELIVRRASGRGPLELVAQNPHPPLTPEPRSWFEQFEDVIRDAAPRTPEGWWQQPTARERVAGWFRKNGMVLRFPPNELGDAEIAELREKLGAFPFVLSGRTIDAQLAASAHVVRIEPAINAADEESGLWFYANVPRA